MNETVDIKNLFCLMNFINEVINQKIPQSYNLKKTLFQTQLFPVLSTKIAKPINKFNWGSTFTVSARITCLNSNIRLLS